MTELFITLAIIGCGTFCMFMGYLIGRWLQAEEDKKKAQGQRVRVYRRRMVVYRNNTVSVAEQCKGVEMKEIEV